MTDAPATYRLLHQLPPHPDDTPGDWTELGTFKADSHQAALAEALNRALANTAESVGRVEPVTVAAVADRFWNQGTGTVELKPAVSWAKS